MHRLYNMIFYYLWVFFCRDAIILRLYNNSFFSDVWCCVPKMFCGRERCVPTVPRHRFVCLVMNICICISIKYARLSKINVSRGTLPSEIDQKDVDVVGADARNACRLSDGCRLVLGKFAAGLSCYRLQLRVVEPFGNAQVL